MNLQQMKAKTVSFSKQALPASEAILPWMQGSTVVVAEYPFGEGVRVKLEIKGLIQFETPDDRMRPLYTGGLDYAGISFSNACYLRAYVDFSKIPGSGLSFGGYNFCPIPRTMADYAINILVGGTATARRGNMPYSQTLCGSVQCPPYIVSGEQRIIITPDSADLNYKGKWNSQIGKALFLPKSGSGIDTYVHFTDSTVPAGMPLRNLAHTWIPGDLTTNLTGSCSNGSLDCLPRIRNTGIMTSNTRVNGVVHPDSVTLYCWETEPILNSDMVRQGLLAVLDSSNAGDPNPSNRHERQFFVLQDTVTPGAKPFVVIMPRHPLADVCSTPVFMPHPDNVNFNHRILGHGHSHPSEPNIRVFCKSLGGKYGDTADGALPLDKKFADSVNHPTKNPLYAAKGWLPMPSFIVDKHFVFRQMPGEKLGDETMGNNRIRHDKGRCAWPKRSI